jgi:1-phosphofructokinase family hexose kinase
MKKSVLTVTPNPALDLSGIVNRLKPNEKSYVRHEIRSPGGNAINVARILTRLQILTLASGFLGGSTGDEIKFLLDEEGVRNKFFSIEGHSRVSVTVSNQFDHKQTRLSFPGPKIKVQERDRLFDWFRSKRGISLLVLGGSLPDGFGTKEVIQQMVLARKNKIESIIDCPGQIMRRLVDEGPLLIKPSLDEFQELTQSRAKSVNAVRREAKKLLERVPFVCVSSVEGGALLVTRGNSYFGRIPRVKIRSTVGAGDSMVGAMAARLFKGDRSGEEFLRWGLAASAATLSHLGTAMGTAREIRALYRATKIETVR